MAQDTLYFPHDYDPLRDPKLRMLIKKRGAIGYSVFWRTVEILHQSSDHTLKFDQDVYSMIADDLNIPSSDVEDVITDCINGCGLFNSLDDFFWSDRVMRNIEKRKSKSDKCSHAGKESARIRQEMKETVEKLSKLFDENSTDVERPLTNVEHPSTKKEIKERE